MANKGLLGDRLSDEQYDYLYAHRGEWFNNMTVVFCNNGFTSIFVDVYDAVTGYWEMDQIARDGTVTHSRSNDETNYRATVWLGTPGTYLYLYGDNGHVAVSSYETLAIGVIPAKRILIDTENLKAFKDTNWLWTNLNNVLGYLKGYGVKAFTNLSYDDIIALAVEWDSGMSYRILSPYMMGWVDGMISELNIADYLLKFYGDKWDHVYDALTAEYNPIDNYNMHELEHTDDVKDEGSINASTTTTDVDASNGTSTTTSNDSDIYAFNSSTASPESSNSGSDSTTETIDSTTGTVANASQEYRTNNDLDRELTRSGNIGVTTTQQMIEQELKVRENIVLATIRDDIVNVMSIPYYGGKY